MGATYTRQSSAGITDGAVIEASDINDEFDQLLAAFVAASGHTHDGTAAEGGPVTKLLGTAITIGDATSGTDIAVTFDGETADGVLTWMEDEDYFKFSDEVLMNSTEKLLFGDTGTYIHQSADGVLDLVSDTEIEINATTIDINGAVAMDGAITGATNITLSGELDAATLDISGNADIDGTLEADAITINSTAIGSIYGVIAGSSSIVTTGALDSGSITSGFGTIDTGSSTITTTGLISGGSLDIDNVLINGTTIGHTDDTDLITLADGVATVAGELDATTLDISGNADIDGTTNLDAVDIDGAVQIDATFTSGVDGQGYDTKFFGDTASAYMLWDTNVDDLILAGGAGLIVPVGQFTLGSVALTSTATELNLIDGNTSRGTTAVASGDGILINDGGTMAMTNVDTVSTYFAGHSVGGSNIVTVGTIGTGVWQGTAIASGYIAADAITGAKIADDAIDSEHYTDGSIDNAHIADDAIDSEHYADGSIDNAHIADDAIDSEHYADGSIDNAHIADDAIDSEHYAAGSIDTAHIADDQITLGKMAGGTDGNIISYDASGDPVAIATGSDGQVLTSTGAGSPPAFETSSGITMGKAIAAAIVFG